MKTKPAKLLAALFGAAAMALACAPALAQPAAEGNNAQQRIPVEAFFKKPFFTGAKLSPNGGYLAMRVGEEQTRFRLIVLDLVNNTIKPVAAFRDQDIGSYIWVGDDRLVFTTYDSLARPGDQWRGGTWAYAINRDGTGMRQLIGDDDNAAGNVRKNMLSSDYGLFDLDGANKDGMVYVTNAVWGSQRIEADSLPLYINLYKLDVNTGRTTIVDRPAKSQLWEVDYHGEARLTASTEEDKITYFYRDPASNQWRKLKTMGYIRTEKDAWTPVGFAPDGNLYVRSMKGGDKAALYRLDLATGNTDAKPLVALQDFDFDGELVNGEGKLLGVRFVTDAEATIWFDEKYKAMQADIDARLPNTANHIHPNRVQATPWIKVEAQSATTPTVYYLYNTASKSLTQIGAKLPTIDPARMAQADFVRYKARDGLEIPAWMTIPRGTSGKNLPLVMVVHGGPWVKGDHWTFNREVQFLASRGYAVMQPQFRGTQGYGDKHYTASFKQWGKAMQDDIADGAKWAIAQGIADPKRICIMGGSYGGYSTLMGLINDPDLYKCGINTVGVTDINLMYDGHWSAQSDYSLLFKKYGMPEMVGDQAKDAEQLKATSPLLQAHRIRQPLLLGYGALDRRVPIYHGRKFYDTVVKTNKDVQLVVYDDEGHGWRYFKNDVDWYTRVGKFLDQHIGKQQ
jgi:dipeptidyl aminopeptidase/acylaminoacyl peptidase